MKNIFNISEQTKKLLIGIFIVIVISVAIAYVYYDGKNKAEDPRITNAKYLFIRFDELMKENNFSSALPILDTIESILQKVPGYDLSYEPGIVLNNRGSAYISMALYSNIDSVEKSELLDMAKINIDSGIVLYTKWLDKNTSLSGEALLENVKPYFPENDLAFQGRNYTRILKKRVEDIMLARKELPRRLSVCYTNLGIVLRHQHKQNEAVECYMKAIILWKDNFTARNNFNVLMGKPPEDRSIIEKLFPPDKNKFE